MIVVLPIFKEYTVDERLREFRKMVYGKPLVFIPFNSVKGQELLAEMEKSKRIKLLLAEIKEG